MPEVPGPGGAVNIQPRLLLTLVDVVPAYHPAPPVALESRILKKLTLTVPDDLLNVARVAAILLLIVTKLPAVPERVKLVNVCVELAVKVIVLGLVVAVRSANELLPDMVNAPAPP